MVTNTGDDPLTDVLVTDDQGVAVSCPQTTLAPDASMTCTAPAGTAEPGQYENLATASATGTGADRPRLRPLALLRRPALDRHREVDQRRRRRRRARAARSPSATRCRWTYEITNTGNVALRWSASDDQGVRAGLPAASCSSSPARRSSAAAGPQRAGRPIREHRHRDRHQLHGDRGHRRPTRPTTSAPARELDDREVDQRDRRRRRPRAPDPRRRPGHLDLRGHQPRQRGDRRRRASTTTRTGRQARLRRRRRRLDGLLDPAETVDLRRPPGTATAGQYDEHRHRHRHRPAGRSG